MKKQIFLLSAALVFCLCTPSVQAQSGRAQPDGARSANDAATTQGTFPELKPAAESELKPHFGIQVGYAEPGDDYDAAAQYGIEFGYQPYVPFALGVELNSFLSDKDDSDNMRRTTAMAKGTYNFGGSIPVLRHSFVGLGLGAAFDTEDNDETNLAVKYLAGVDVPLTGNGLVRSKSFSLGATVSYLTVVNAQDNFALNGQMKYWF